MEVVSDQLKDYTSLFLTLGPSGGANRSQQKTAMTNGSSMAPPGGGGGGGLFGPGGVPAKPSDVRKNSPARGMLLQGSS